MGGCWGQEEHIEDMIPLPCHLYQNLEPRGGGGAGGTLKAWRLRPGQESLSEGSGRSGATPESTPHFSGPLCLDC